MAFSADSEERRLGRAESRTACHSLCQEPASRRSSGLEEQRAARTSGAAPSSTACGGIGIDTRTACSARSGASGDGKGSLRGRGDLGGRQARRAAPQYAGALQHVGAGMQGRQRSHRPCMATWASLACTIIALWSPCAGRQRGRR
jgi:hypothetical protein